MKEFVIDLFCGAGGTSTGVHLANCDSTVTACVNHDAKAIESHRLNHPEAKHFIEDIRNPEVVFFLKLRVDALRKLYPGCIITIWASLECTNFSKAKGGLPRDADSRTLAEHLYMYMEGINPDYLMIENVVEFMAWGPLDEKGKPVSKKRGRDYLRWIDNIRDYGYRFDWKELNAADYGAYTSRTRYFAQFAKGELPISWPEPTHTKNPDKADDLFRKPLLKWKAVKEVLQLNQEGESIFARKKPLVENTLKRIYAGLVKFVANGDDSFIKKYYSGRPMGKVISVNGPAGTITTTGSNQVVVKCDFLLKYNSTNKNGKHVPPDINEPSPTVIAQQGKKPLGLISCERREGSIIIFVYEDDCETMVKIKIFMAYYGIIDIKMRMLFVEELLRIQGFPEGYQLVGTQTDKKKFIGNSVEVTVAKKIFEAHHGALVDYFESRKAA